MRGLAALLPTLITLSVIFYVWNFLWQSLGQHLIWLVKNLQWYLAYPHGQWGDIDRMWEPPRMRPWVKELIGVVLALIAIYIVGLFVGNLIGRTFWKIAETLVMKIPVVRAIYPAVKQVTDFVLSDRQKHFDASRVVAVQPHEKGIWSIGLVTGGDIKGLTEATGEEMVTVFLPNSPAAFSGYVLVVPRKELIELPMTVEQAMKLFVSGGVIPADEDPAAVGRKLPMPET
jgi:uncharacterized membrane protein